ncbi:hypothetical protein [Streptomyces sp. NPDC003077]|uniref:hypothetical protein n=1 Tax=Streptomyces sp. NPDC003077 TaxID=3154443 RepID=UPI0033A3DAC8
MSVYVKTAALGWRAEGCTAGVAVIARFINQSKSTVERGLRVLCEADPYDGIVEMHTVRRTLPGGRGTTALRRVRPVTRREPFIWVPVELSEKLEPRQLRVWAVLAYATTRRIPVTERQIGEILSRPRQGRRPGKAVDTGTVRSVIGELEDMGLVKVHRRVGYQGRNEYEVYRQPLPAADGTPRILTPRPKKRRGTKRCKAGETTTGPATTTTTAQAPAPTAAAPTSTPPEPPSHDTAPAEPEDAAPRDQAGNGDLLPSSDGSGCGSVDGSLAYMEDRCTDRQENNNDDGGVVPAVGELQVVAREAAVENLDFGRAPVENPPTASDRTADFGASDLALRAGGKNTPSPTPHADKAVTEPKIPYGGPPLTFSKRMSWITEPVRWLLARTTTYVQRRFARVLSSQINQGTEPERLRQRLESRFAAANLSEIRSIGGWLLKVAAPRWGCHDPKCESGVLWASGETCAECRAAWVERRQERASKAAGGAPGASEGSAGGHDVLGAARASDGHTAVFRSCVSCIDGCASCGNGTFGATRADGAAVPGAWPTLTPGVSPEVVPDAVAPGIPAPRGQERSPGQAPAGRFAPGERRRPDDWRSDKDEPRCADCRSRTSDLDAGGRCRPCNLAYEIGQAVIAAMDAAGADLHGRRKIAAAHQAAADVRQEADRARTEATEQGLGEDEAGRAALLAAQARAAKWASADA